MKLSDTTYALLAGYVFDHNICSGEYAIYLSQHDRFILGRTNTELSMLFETMFPGRNQLNSYDITGICFIDGDIARSCVQFTDDINNTVTVPDFIVTGPKDIKLAFLAGLSITARSHEYTNGNSTYWYIDEIDQIIRGIVNECGADIPFDDIEHLYLYIESRLPRTKS